MSNFIWVVDYSTSAMIKTLVNVNQIVTVREQKIRIPRGTPGAYDDYPGYKVDLVNNDSVVVGEADWEDLNKLIMATNQSVFESQKTEAQATVDTKPKRKRPPRKKPAPAPVAA